MNVCVPLLLFFLSVSLSIYFSPRKYPFSFSLPLFDPSLIPCLSRSLNTHTNNLKRSCFSFPTFFLSSILSIFRSRVYFYDPGIWCSLFRFSTRLAHRFCWKMEVPTLPCFSQSVWICSYLSACHVVLLQNVYHNWNNRDNKWVKSGIYLTLSCSFLSHTHILVQKWA